MSIKIFSRRSFLKSMGVAAAALGTGVATGNYFTEKARKSFSVNGFLPGDEQILFESVTAFANKTGNIFKPLIIAENKIKEIIQKAYFSVDKENGFFDNGNITFRVVKINSNINSDILLSDNFNSIYDPLEDFSGGFILLRNKLQNRKAEYFFTATYEEKNFLNKIFDHEKFAVIENEKGLADKIELNKDYKSISVNGTQGKTILKVESGKVHVHSSACRHELCKLSGFASKRGDFIACAPNKVIIKIESA